MKHVAADLFDAAGEKWIVLVDRYSGYAWIDKLRDTSTATVTAKLLGLVCLCTSHMGTQDTLSCLE